MGVLRDRGQVVIQYIVGDATNPLAKGQKIIEEITAVTVPPSRIIVAKRPRLPIPGEVGRRQLP